MFMLLVCVLLPLGLGGVTGAVPAATAEGQFYTQAMTTIVGHGAASFFTICIIASLLLSMTSSTADAGRALYGISRAGMTIKQLGVLNRYHVPGRAMTVDLFVNLALVVFITSNLAILYMSNIGYVLCHVFALSGFLLLRRDRPELAAPDQGGRVLGADRGVLCALNAVFLAGRVRSRRSSTATAPGPTSRSASAILVASLLLFFFRRIVQDGESVHWSEPTPDVPDAESSPRSKRRRAAPVTVGVA